MDCSAFVEEGLDIHKGREEERTELDEKEEDGKQNSILRFSLCEESTWTSSTSDLTVGINKIPRKQCPVQATFYSSGQYASSLGEAATNDTEVKCWEVEGLIKMGPDQVQLGREMQEGSMRVMVRDGTEGCVAEREEQEGMEKEGRDESSDIMWKARDDRKARWRVQKRQRLKGSVEEENEKERLEMERDGRKRWSQRGRKENVEEDPQIAENGAEALDQVASIRNPTISRILLNSSSSSTSSSFNYSSVESDEVFSDEEETTTKEQCITNKKACSWRTFLTMMQWSARRKSSWVQLAGHPGNFCPSEGGEYYGVTSRGNERYMRLEDLLSGKSFPVIMDCKMGVRTYLEKDLSKVQHGDSLRSDMYWKMVKVDPAAPTVEEHALRAVTKPRYLQWRDSLSSSSTLGFRIEGITKENGRVLRDFKMTRTLAQVTDTVLTFTKNQPNVLKDYLSRLMALDEALKESEFFKTHEIIGSSLLFIHDRRSKANIWMIDFGKTFPTPSGVYLKHNIPWIEGNQEDGYLTGLASLTSVVKEALLEAEKLNPGDCNTDTQHELQTHYVSVSKDVIQEISQSAPAFSPRDTVLAEVFSCVHLEANSSIEASTTQKSV
ncbi:inositol-trisphosphate 3-kinase B-like isoform X2 [Brienomyrus brachyistius]|uniref:inositol-trisphosphate 3-kinase B-like isoform X2 n=1 Tax=Brienomyrus brachyistius TaxID=42636 RepID=UPI0020B1C854|nr:inositol-trisphosphate 3-kinase B-like isoform X2 [Brienomyrus brachyistius]